MRGVEAWLGEGAGMEAEWVEFFGYGIDLEGSEAGVTGACSGCCKAGTSVRRRSSGPFTSLVEILTTLSASDNIDRRKNGRGRTCSFMRVVGLFDHSYLASRLHSVYNGHLPFC